MQSIVSVDPFRCRMWALHDRLECQLNETTCRQEIESFLRHGQLVPALGRPLKADPTHDIELVYGARRLFVARHLNMPLKVELREMPDRECIVAMDIENRHRTDISPYERGISYAHWLREGCFSSQDELSRALRVSPSQVSRLLKLSRLPSIIVQAFQSPVDICEDWGLALLEAVGDPRRRETTIQRARTLAAATVRQPAREVYRQLTAAPSPGRKPRRVSHTQVVVNDEGTPLFRIKHQARGICILLSNSKVTARTMCDIREALTSLLDSRVNRIDRARRVDEARAES